MFVHTDGYRPCGAGNLQGCLWASTCAGFTLLETVISTALMVVILGVTLSAVVYYQLSYSRTEAQSDIYENVRGVAELMAQEIGQAGLVSLPSSTITVAITTTGSKTVNVSSATSMYVGEQVLVDAGTNEELVTLTGVSGSTMTAVFGKTHLINVPVTVLGVFPSGIVPPGATDGSTSIAEPGVSV